MSHAIYQTPAIILQTRNIRESNRLLVLYTKKFGLVYAVSQSLRESKSKMRYHTLLLSLVEIDLVEGKDIWRLTGIHENISSLLFAGTVWFEMLGRISTLLIRLCRGEEENPALFYDIEFLYTSLEHKSLSEEYIRFYEVIFVCRVLYHLGYWEGDEKFITDKNLFSREAQEYVQLHYRPLVKKINDRVQGSQL